MKQNIKVKDNSWQNLKRIYAMMFKYWAYIVGGLLSMMLYAGFNGVSITMVIPLLDVVLKGNYSIVHIHNLTGLLQALSVKLTAFFNNGFTLGSLKSIKSSGILNDFKAVLLDTDPMVVLWAVSILVVTMFFMKNVFFYLNKYMFTNLRGRTVRDIRGRMFEKYLSQSLAFFNQNRVGDSLVRMDNDVYIVSYEFINNLFICLRDLMVMISCMIVAFLMNPHLFLISLIVTPIFALSISYIGRKIKKYAKRIQAQYSTMSSRVEESLNSMRIVKAYSKEEFELNKYKSINEKYRRIWQKVEMYNALNLPISEISTGLIGATLLLIAGKQIIYSQGGFTLGEFTAFLIAIFATMHPLKTLTQAYANIKRALVSLDRISYVLEFETEIREADNPVSKKDFTRSIEFRDVSFHYHNNKKVLKNITYTINKGEKVAIIGSSGSGKTTMVNLLNRMYDYSEGEILIDGIQIKEIRIIDLRSLFGVVPQESILFSNTFFYNIQYGNQQELSQEQVEKAARISYSDEFIELYPDKYQHMLQTKASDLSGGQKQRLCIARALAADPPILIFDEATSALDTDSERKVQEAIDRATENRTVIIIAHRLSTILSADKIIVLEKGTIMGIGNHEELITICERYQQLYNLQFNVDEKEETSA